MTCDAFDDAVTELALGHLSEPQRSALLAHAGTCARCAAELADVVAVTDGLLELAPELEPPVGFEQRVVAPAAGAGPRRRSPWLVAAAAAAIVAVYLPGVLRGDRPIERDATVLTAAGEPAGTMTLDDDALVLVLDGDADWPGTWSCEIRTDGGWVEVGSWTAADVVERTWRVGVAGDVARSATAMRVRSARGDVLYTAALD
jgi:hypothetical protein